MKMKRFLLMTLILCAFQVPAYAEIEENPLTASTSAAGGLAKELFTFDPRLASIKLEYVDFKIDRGRSPAETGRDIGKYNFKLFGCKRADKKLVLDEGRAMRRDMKFGNVFFEEMNEIFPVVVNKDNPYFPYSIGDVIPGYVITAEIKDLYVNVCDHYDWRTRKYSQLRSGSAEIKVLWRVMTPFNRKLHWEDTTYGYATIEDPIRNGEVRLVEKAFADALTRIIGMPGFMETVRRVPSESDMNKAKKDFEAMAYFHVKNRQKLISSYRRNRIAFAHERSKYKVFDKLERIGRSDTLSSNSLTKEELLKALSQEDFKKLEALGITDKNLTVGDLNKTEVINALSEESIEKLEQLGLSEKSFDGLEKEGSQKDLAQSDLTTGQYAKGLKQEGLDKEGAGDKGLDPSSLATEVKVKGLDGSAVKVEVTVKGLGEGTVTVDVEEEEEEKEFDEQEYGFYGKLLKGDNLRLGVMGRILPPSSLMRLFDGYLLSTTSLDNEVMDSVLNSDLAMIGNKYGFTVSTADGYIIINNQKPFRYLSPSRMYRVRSSIVAVTNDEDVGAGLVIAPSLILTNYSIAKKSPYIKVEFLDGRILPAMVLRVHKDKDVALLYIPPVEFDETNWPVPLRLDLPDIGEQFYAIGTPMRGGFEGALEPGKVAGYRYSDLGVEILTNTNVQSVTLGGTLVDQSGNATGLAHSGKSLIETRDGFIPIGDAFDALKIRIRDRPMDETPSAKALRIKMERDEYIK